jgi:hypothetical protein
MADTKSRAPFRRRHKLALQAVSFVVMMAAPVAMWAAVEAGAMGGATGGLTAMAASMALAMWVS